MMGHEYTLVVVLVAIGSVLSQGTNSTTTVAGNNNITGAASADGGIQLNGTNTTQPGGGRNTSNSLPATNITTPGAPTYAFDDRELLKKAACNSTVKCPPRSECVQYSEANVTKLGCRCKTAMNYTVNSDKQSCYYPAQLEDRCGDGGKCLFNNSACKDDGTNEGISRCLCRDGYAEITQVNPRVCGKKLTDHEDSSCIQCNRNEGTCYDADGDNKMDGCKCKASRSGAHCQKLHVSVKCNIKNFSMTICYEPHEGMNLTLGGMMAVTSQADNEACKGKVVIDSRPDCPKGFYYLTLPMRDGLRDTCKTRKLYPDKNTEKYENQISVENYDNTRRISFKTYCSYMKETQKSIGGVGMVELNGNDRGEEKKAQLKFEVKNRMDLPLEKGALVRIGEHIMFGIRLIKDGTYSAMKIKHCTASDSATSPDPYSRTLAIIIDGCPAKEQKVITVGNNFSPMKDPLTGQPMLSEWGTKFIKAFKLSGSDLFIHCKIQLCLSGNEDNCAPPTCKGRARRAAAESNTQTADVSTSLTVRDDGDPLPSQQQSDKQTVETSMVSMTTTGFIVLLTILIAMLIISLAVTFTIYIHFRRRKRTVSDIQDLKEGKPQRFALPRINQTHMRL